MSAARSGHACLRSCASSARSHIAPDSSRSDTTWSERRTGPPVPTSAHTSESWLWTRPAGSSDMRPAAVSTNSALRWRSRSTRPTVPTQPVTVQEAQLEAAHRSARLVRRRRALGSVQPAHSPAISPRPRSRAFLVSEVRVRRLGCDDQRVVPNLRRLDVINVLDPDGAGVRVDTPDVGLQDPDVGTILE